MGYGNGWGKRGNPRVVVVAAPSKDTGVCCDFIYHKNSIGSYLGLRLIHFCIRAATLSA